MTALLSSAIDSAPDDAAPAGSPVVESEMELAFAGLHQLCGPLVDRLDRLPVPQQQALRVVFGLSGGDASGRFVVGLRDAGPALRAAEDQPVAVRDR